VLGQVGLDAAADRRIGGFSLGMRQRLGLATALPHDPEILVLDEPANGLDPEGVRWLRDLVRGLAAEGRTVLVSSHILTDGAWVGTAFLACPEATVVPAARDWIVSASQTGTSYGRVFDVSEKRLRRALAQA
jgi:ABC-2 type transport system ATP-binding protein